MHDKRGQLYREAMLSDGRKMLFTRIRIEGAPVVIAVLGKPDQHGIIEAPYKARQRKLGSVLPQRLAWKDRR